MTTDMIEYNALVADVTAFDNDFEAKRKKRTRIILLVLLCLAIPFLYLRLFNTEFVLEYKNTISLKYSTAWVVRFPAEFEGQEIYRVDNNDSIIYCAPHTIFADIEEGIEEVSGFGGCSFFAVRFPSTLNKINVGAFWCSPNLSFLIFPEKVTDLEIRQMAFQETPIITLDLPEGTSEIDYLAFSRCTNLRSVKLPDSIENLSTGIFMGCTNLEYILFPDSLEYIDENTLYYCENLKRIDWPSSLQSIAPTALEESSFWDKDISELNLPENVYFARTASDTFLDFDKENAILSERSGIPLEILEEATSSEKVWIEGNWYSLPMSYEEFLSTDDAWEFIEKGYDEYITITLKHSESGGKIKLLLTSETVRGIEISDSYENGPCSVVFPGGLICDYSKWYRACHFISDCSYLSYWKQDYVYGTYRTNETFHLYTKSNDNGTLKWIQFLVK